MKENADWSWRVILVERKGVTWEDTAEHEHTCLLGERRGYRCAGLCHQPGPWASVSATILLLFANISWSWGVEELMRLWEEPRCV